MCARKKTRYKRVLSGHWKLFVSLFIVSTRKTFKTGLNGHILCFVAIQPGFFCAIVNVCRRANPRRNKSDPKLPDPTIMFFFKVSKENA